MHGQAFGAREGRLAGRQHIFQFFCRAAGSSAAAISRAKATATPPSTSSARWRARPRQHISVGPKCACAATPKAFSTCTLAHGTRLCNTAEMADVPWRMVPACSLSGPIIKPGSSTKLTIGRWKLLQKSTKRRVFALPLRHGTGIIHAIIANNADAFAIRRASPVMRLGPYLRDISKNSRRRHRGQPQLQ